MTREEVIKDIQFVRNYLDDTSKMAISFDMAIKALEQEPCEDAISREAVIEQINEWCVKEWNYTNATEYLHKRIKALPNVTPKEKVGHWIIDDVISTWVCSECKKTRIDNRIDHMKYCNSCGARMENIHETDN